MRKRTTSVGMGVLLFAGCSATLPPPQPEKMPVPSEDQELMTTRPKVEYPIEIETDPEPEPELEPEVVELEPEAAPAMQACLPSTAIITAALEPEALRLCWNQRGDVVTGDDVCLWIDKESGHARAGAVPSIVP